MPTSRSGRAAVAQPTEVVQFRDGNRRHHLAARLAVMVPGARTIRVSLYQPTRIRPNRYACAYDERGQAMSLNWTQRMAAACRAIRADPEANWDEKRDLDLTTSILQLVRRATYVPSDGGC